MKRKLSALLVPAALACTLSVQALPNPSVQKCIDLGGKSFNVTGKLGEMGVCKFDTALICNWTLFRYLNGRDQKAVEAYKNRASVDLQMDGRVGTHSFLPNPASVYCTQVGGQVELVKSKDGELGLCKFDDNSRIEEWTLFRGVNNPANEKLNDALGFESDNSLKN